MVASEAKDTTVTTSVLLTSSVMMVRLAPVKRVGKVTVSISLCTAQICLEDLEQNITVDGADMLSNATMQQYAA